uniref:Laccase n=1 Tax=Acrobeloides nanus TaxID=290746 RepID=A0A914CJR9_9BILA
MTTNGPQGYQLVDYEPNDFNKVIKNSNKFVNLFVFSSPAQPIVVPFGAKVILRVQNDLMQDSITLHVHGMQMKGTWYMDGAAFVTQCPIAPRSRFAYRFIADTPGTHWFHGHLGVDRAQGFLGAFIVKDIQRFPLPQPNIMGREYAVVMQDWTLNDAKEVWLKQKWRSWKWQDGYDGADKNKCWNAPVAADGAYFGSSAIVRSILINDKGWHDQNDIMIRPNTLPLETFRIRRDETIRLRLINGGVSQQLMVSINNHDFLVVAADGDEIIPIKAQMIILFPGERYDILIQGLNNPTKSTYSIIFETMEYLVAKTSVMPKFGVAKLVYEDVRSEYGNQVLEGS